MQDHGKRNGVREQQRSLQRPEGHPVLREEVEEAMHGLKAGNSPGVDSIPSELLTNGGEATAQP